MKKMQNALFSLSVDTGAPNRIRISIFKRQNNYTDIALFHPTIEQAIKQVRDGAGENYGNHYGHNYEPKERGQ